ncbi:MAG: hypothetical protein PHO10_11430 [Gemmiger sp.]|nr:hypothetical protein [Gemmiger sp.]
MATALRRLRISLTPDLNEKVELVKKESQTQNQSEILRTLIARGLSTLESGSTQLPPADGDSQSL